MQVTYQSDIRTALPYVEGDEDGWVGLSRYGTFTISYASIELVEQNHEVCMVFPYIKDVNGDKLLITSGDWIVRGTGGHVQVYDKDTLLAFYSFVEVLENV